MSSSFKSQARKWIVVFGGLAALVSGCAGEEEPHFTVPKIELSGASCLKEAVKKTDQLLEGDGSVEDVYAVRDCFGYALNTFRKYVRGENHGEYSGYELRNFLHSYFLDEPSISDGLVDEVMVLKRLFLGGSDRVVTIQELELAVSLVEKLADIVAVLHPHVTLLLESGSQKTLPRDQELISAESALELAGTKFVGLIHQDSGVAYGLSNLTRLFEEVQKFMKRTAPQIADRDLTRFLPLGFKIKALLLGTDQTKISPSDWQHLGVMLARGIGVFVRGRYTLKEDVLYDPVRIASLQQMAAGAFRALRVSREAREGRAIEAREFRALLEELARLDMMPLDFDVDSAHGILTWALDRVLQVGAPASPPGLSVDKLDYLEGLTAGFLGVQRNLTVAASAQSAGDGGTRLTLDPVSGKSADWREMMDILGGPWSLSLDDKGRVTFAGESGATNLSGSTRLNFARVLFRPLFLAYIEDPTRREGLLRLSREELRQAFLDVHPVLVALDLVDPDDFTYDTQLMRDADLFMPRSDSDQFVSLHELIEYIHLVYAGIDAGKSFYSGLATECLIEESLVSSDCFRSAFRDQYRLTLDHMPHFVSYVDQQPADLWLEDIANLEVAFRGGEVDATEPIRKADLYEAFVILQYVEMLMLRFDLDRSADLNEPEVLAAYEHFKEVIGRLLGIDPNDPEKGEELKSAIVEMLLGGNRSTILLILAGLNSLD